MAACYRNFAIDHLLCFWRDLFVTHAKDRPNERCCCPNLLAASGRGGVLSGGPKSDWESNIPSSADPYNCDLRHRYDSDTPQANSEEVCGEPYTVDTGTG